MFSTNDHQRVLNVLGKLIPPGTTARWARISKVPELKLHAKVEAFTWIQTNRNGGGFKIILSYGKHVSSHSCILTRMFTDFLCYVRSRIEETKTITNRRSTLVMPINHAINSSRDLEFLIDGQWYPFGRVLPNRVRMLKEPDTTNWILRGGAVKKRYSCSRILSPLPPPPSYPLPIPPPPVLTSEYNMIFDFDEPYLNSPTASDPFIDQYDNVLDLNYSDKLPNILDNGMW